MHYVCRICGTHFPISQDQAFGAHITRCYRRNEAELDALRPAGVPWEGDPELLAFARAEGDVYNRQAGTRRRPR